MKKILRAFLIVSVLGAAGIGAAFFYMNKLVKEREEAPYVPPTEMTYLTPTVVSSESMEDQIKAKLNDGKELDVYTDKYQAAADAIVNDLKTVSGAAYSLQEPLLIMNPYGTNRTGLYIYFKNDERVNTKYTVKVKDESIPDFSADLFTNAAGMPLQEQEGQIIGLLQGQTNYIIMYLYDRDGALVGKAGYKIEVPDFGTIKEPVLEREMSRNDNQLTDGLFCIFGYDRRNENEIRHLLFYDNNGIIRAEVPLHGKIVDNNMYYHGGNMIYTCGVRKIASMNRLGKLEKIYKLGKKYSIHHDFCVRDTSDKAVILVDNLDKDTKEDVIVWLDLYTGEYGKLIDFEKLMPEIRKKAILAPDTNKIDWIHINSITMINDTDILISLRELSSIMRINNVFEDPQIEYIIGHDEFYKGTKYANLLLSQEESFVPSAGQHSVRYLGSNGLEDGQYYISMFDNNFGSSTSRPDVSYSSIPGAGDLEHDADFSYYYKYLVDEKKKTYNRVFQISLPYSSIVSSVQEYGGNIVTASGTAKVFEEYNDSGKRVARYYTHPENFIFRVFKYDMKGFWFAD